MKSNNIQKPNSDVSAGNGTKPIVSRRLLPNCKYCGKFVNPSKHDVSSQEIWGHLGLDDVVYFHNECKSSNGG